jgi:hypothetical protein
VDGRSWAVHDRRKLIPWVVDHVPLISLSQAVVAEQISSFAKFPPRQKPASFNLDEVLAQVSPHRNPRPPR